MRLYFELSEVVAYPLGKRIILDTLTVDRVEKRLVNDCAWNPKIAHLAAVHQMNIHTMPLSESLAAAYAAGCIAMSYKVSQAIAPEV